jgi:diadenosine tetraphosphatase ApaH/serine/threonine PP2A family protein phosphatase
MRVVVLSDIHSNLVALDAVLAHAGPVDAVWHLGDVVGYGPSPDAVVSRLGDLAAVGVLGNHDAAALGGPEIDWFNPDARAAAVWTRDTIDEPTSRWLRDQPLTRDVEGVHLVHGSPRDPLREYITTREVAIANLDALPGAVGLHGHTHVAAAFVRTEQGVEVTIPGDGQAVTLDSRPTLVNPGSVGQPRDGDARAGYAVLDLAARSVVWHRVPYDIPRTQASMRAAGLPVRLIERLAFGQ